MANLTGKELAGKILGGERDFEKIVLPDATDLREFIPELNEYLEKEDLRKCPLNFNSARFVGVVAPRLYFPYSYLIKADMTRADMTRADMSGANMYGANMSGANMYGANMSGANMTRADMTEANMTEANMTLADMTLANMTLANMYGADMYGANMTEADMRWADIREAPNLNKARGLETAVFFNTIVTPKEQGVIENARKNLKLFDVREE